MGSLKKTLKTFVVCILVFAFAIPLSFAYDRQCFRGEERHVMRKYYNEREIGGLVVGHKNDIENMMAGLCRAQTSESAGNNIAKTEYQGNPEEPAQPAPDKTAKNVE